jgi:hypothetical protein
MKLFELTRYVKLDIEDGDRVKYDVALKAADKKYSKRMVRFFFFHQQKA